MRTTLAVLGIVAVCAVASSAWANNVVFQFNASDFLNVTATTPGSAYDQENARRVRAWDANGTETNHGTWSTSIADYNAWKASLTPGEGICEFAMWMVPNSSFGNTYNTRIGYAVAGGSTWGANTTGQVLYGFAPEGWNFTVADYTGAGGHLLLPTWYTTDPSKYLRPGTDLGKTFGFAANLADWTSGTAEDVVAGNSYRMWIWSDSMAESTATTGLLTENTFQFAGVTNPSTDGSEVDFRAIVNMTAQPVPEPITMTLVGMGIAGLGGYIRRRRAK